MSDFGTKLGNLITAKREAKGWSFAQTALAVYGDDGAGGDKRKGDIQRLEAGKSRKPNAATLKKLRDGLGITQEEIDACRATPEELRLAHHADRLFEVIAAGARAAGLSDALAGELTDRYAEGNPDDFDGALKGLARALKAAEEREGRPALPTNTDDAVVQMLTEVNKLNSNGQIDAAADLIASATTKLKSVVSEIYDAGVYQAILTSSPAKACQYEAEKIRLSAPNPDRLFDPYQDAAQRWHRQGTDLGVRFDLEVSVRLSSMAIQFARNSCEKGKAIRSRALTEKVLGEQDITDSRLLQALRSFEQAIEELDQCADKLEQGLALDGLGKTQQRLGSKNKDIEMLENACNNLSSAIRIFKFKEEFKKCANSTSHRGTVYRSLAKITKRKDYAKKAVQDNRAALGALVKNNDLQGWAITSICLANALNTLGDIQMDGDQFSNAKEISNEVLQAITKEQFPRIYVDALISRATSQRYLSIITKNADDASAALKDAEEALPLCESLEDHLQATQIRALIEGLRSILED